MKPETVNLRRAAAIRRHRSNPSIVAALKEKILGAALRDCSSKEIGLLVELSAGMACKWIHALGFRRMYVTDEERKHLLRRRGVLEQQKEAA